MSECDSSDHRLAYCRKLYSKTFSTSPKLLQGFATNFVDILHAKYIHDQLLLMYICKSI